MRHGGWGVASPRSVWDGAEGQYVHSPIKVSVWPLLGPLLTRGILAAKGEKLPCYQLLIHKRERNGSFCRNAYRSSVQPPGGRRSHTGCDASGPRLCGATRRADPRARDQGSAVFIEALVCGLQSVAMCSDAGYRHRPGALFKFEVWIGRSDITFLAVNRCHRPECARGWAIRSTICVAACCR